MKKITVNGIYIRRASVAGILLVEFDAGRNTIRAGNTVWLDKLHSVGMSVFIPIKDNHSYVLTMARLAVGRANKAPNHKLMFALIKTDDLIEIVRIK